jgi:hypothetical protein
MSIQKGCRRRAAHAASRGILPKYVGCFVVPPCHVMGKRAACSRSTRSRSLSAELVTRFMASHANRRRLGLCTAFGTLITSLGSFSSDVSPFTLRSRHRITATFLVIIAKQWKGAMALLRERIIAPRGDCGPGKWCPVRAWLVVPKGSHEPESGRLGRLCSRRARGLPWPGSAGRPGKCVVDDLLATRGNLETREPRLWQPPSRLDTF